MRNSPVVWFLAFLILLGMLMNVTVMAANGWHMPVAVQYQGRETLPPKYITINQSTKLRWLGDTINVSNPLMGPSFASPGDALMWITLLVLTAWAVCDAKPKVATT